MTTRWRRRLVLTVLVTLVASIAMLLLGMHPRVALICGIVLVIATICWLALDVGSLVEEIDWERHADRREIWARSDQRVNLIRARLHRERRRDEWASTADQLADLIDAKLSLTSQLGSGSVFSLTLPPGTASHDTVPLPARQER